MERSRVNVEFKFLPQQVFEHEREGVHCVVELIDGTTPEHLTKAQALDAVQARLQRWQGDTAGFTLPVTDYAEDYVLRVPSTVQWDLWPRVYSCEQCGSVFRTDEQTPLVRQCVRPGCRGDHRQLPYYRVHRCGKRQQLIIPKCDNNADHQMSFHDSGSFLTAHFRCTVCGIRKDIQPGYCRGCTMNAAGSDRRMRLVKARDSKAYYPHHVTVINITSRLAKAMETDRGSLWAMAHYLGVVADIAGLVDEANGRARNADNDALRKLKELIAATENDNDRAGMLALVEDPAETGMSDAERLLNADTVDAGRVDRRLMERVFVFHEHRPDDLETVESRYRQSGHHGMAIRTKEGIRLADELGFSKVAVVRELPIALVAFGYTREFSDHRAQLRPLDPPTRQNNAKYPLVTVESNTEAVYFELDPVRLWSWCNSNGWDNSPRPVTPTEARAWLLNTTYGNSGSPAALAIQRLTHAWSHTLIHSLEGRSAFGPDSVAEHLMERLGSFLLYVANYSTFNLGGLTTVAEQHLFEWLDAARDQVVCVHDPVCLSERGGCHKCLALAFHCERFNRGLHRGYLLGSHDPGISEGWLVHAGPQ